MDLGNIERFKQAKQPPHEKSAIVNLFMEFIGDEEQIKKRSYTFWLRQVGKCKYSDAIDILKSLESMPIEYNKAGAIINKLKKFNGNKRPIIKTN